MKITYKESKELRKEDIIALYKANRWSSAGKPEPLLKALLNSHTLLTAWNGDKLVGLGNALSDGYLVVYYSHLLILPEYQGKGIGQGIMKKFQEKYKGFHQQMVVADEKAIDFYKTCGFEKAGKTEAMWIYKGNDH